MLTTCMSGCTTIRSYGNPKALTMLKEFEILVCKNLLLRRSYYNPAIYSRLAWKHLVKNQMYRPKSK